MKKKLIRFLYSTLQVFGSLFDRTTLLWSVITIQLIFNCMFFLHIQTNMHLNRTLVQSMLTLIDMDKIRGSQIETLEKKLNKTPSKYKDDNQLYLVNNSNTTAQERDYFIQFINKVFHTLQTAESLLREPRTHISDLKAAKEWIIKCKPASLSEFNEWRVGFRLTHGQAFLSTLNMNNVLIATENITVTPLYGDASVSIIIPVGIHVSISALGIGDNRLHIMDGYNYTGRARYSFDVADVKL